MMHPFPKIKMQTLVKKAFDELVASGEAPNEAAAQAIARAKKEQLQEELVAQSWRNQQEHRHEKKGPFSTFIASMYLAWHISVASIR